MTIAKQYSCWAPNEPYWITWFLTLLLLLFLVLNWPNDNVYKPKKNYAIGFLLSGPSCKKIFKHQSWLELWKGRFCRNFCMSIQLCSYHLCSLSLFHIILWGTTQRIFYQEIGGLPFEPSTVCFTTCIIFRKLLRSFRLLFLHLE